MLAVFGIGQTELILLAGIGLCCGTGLIVFSLVIFAILKR
jgi:hypothetical protein